MSKRHIYTRAVLENLVNLGNSCVSIVNCERKIALHPVHLSNIQSGVCDILYRSLKKYDPYVKGFLMGYRNVKIVLDKNTGKISGRGGEFEVTVNLEFFVFQPKIGGLLEGVVNKKSKNHVGCLVHRYFNATLLKPEEVEYEDWECRDIEIDQNIVFKVIELDFTGPLPYIEGRLKNENSRKFKRQKKVSNTLSDSSAQRIETPEAVLPQESFLEIEFSQSQSEEISPQKKLKAMKTKKASTVFSDEQESTPVASEKVSKEAKRELDFNFLSPVITSDAITKDQRKDKKKKKKKELERISDNETDAVSKDQQSLIEKMNGPTNLLSPNPSQSPTAKCKKKRKTEDEENFLKSDYGPWTSTQIPAVDKQSDELNFEFLSPVAVSGSPSKRKKKKKKEHKERSWGYDDGMCSSTQVPVTEKETERVDFDFLSPVHAPDSTPGSKKKKAKKEKKKEKIQSDENGLQSPKKILLTEKNNEEIKNLMNVTPDSHSPRKKKKKKSETEKNSKSLSDAPPTSSYISPTKKSPTVDEINRDEEIKNLMNMIKAATVPEIDELPMSSKVKTEKKAKSSKSIKSEIPSFDEKFRDKERFSLGEKQDGADCRSPKKSPKKSPNKLITEEKAIATKDQAITNTPVKSPIKDSIKGSLTNDLRANLTLDEADEDSVDFIPETQVPCDKKSKSFQEILQLRESRTEKRKRPEFAAEKSLFSDSDASCKGTPTKRLRLEFNEKPVMVNFEGNKKDAELINRTVKDQKISSPKVNRQGSVSDANAKLSPQKNKTTSKDCLPSPNKGSPALYSTKIQEKLVKKILKETKKTILKSASEFKQGDGDQSAVERKRIDRAKIESLLDKAFSETKRIIMSNEDFMTPLKKGTDKDKKTKTTKLTKKLLQDQIKALQKEERAGSVKSSSVESEAHKTKPSELKTESSDSGFNSAAQKLSEEDDLPSISQLLLLAEKQINYKKKRSRKNLSV